MFRVGGEPVEKELAVGDGFMRTSAERPGWCWSDILLQPAEPPFRPRLRGPGDPNRLPRPRLLDQRHRLVAGLLLCRLDVLCLVFSPIAKGEPVARPLLP